MVKTTPANAGDTTLIPDPGRSHERGATKLTYHSYWVCALARELLLLKPTSLEPVPWSKRSLRSKQPAHCNSRVAPVHRSQGKAHTAVQTQGSQETKVNFQKSLKKMLFLHHLLQVIQMISSRLSPRFSTSFSFHCFSLLPICFPPALQGCVCVCVCVCRPCLSPFFKEEESIFCVVSEWKGD